MVPLLEKFMLRLRTGEGKKLPNNTKIIDIENISFQNKVGSDEYIFNVWLKAHTGIPNRTTFNYRLKNIQQCLDIKLEMDKEYELDDGDLLEDENTEIPFGEQPTEDISSSMVAERSDTIVKEEGSFFTQ